MCFCCNHGFVWLYGTVLTERKTELFFRPKEKLVWLELSHIIQRQSRRYIHMHIINIYIYIYIYFYVNLNIYLYIIIFTCGKYFYISENKKNMYSQNEGNVDSAVMFRGVLGGVLSSFTSDLGSISSPLSIQCTP